MLLVQSVKLVWLHLFELLHAVELLKTFERHISGTWVLIDLLLNLVLTSILGQTGRPCVEGSNQAEATSLNTFIEVLSKQIGEVVVGSFTLRLFGIDPLHHLFITEGISWHGQGDTLWLFNIVDSIPVNCKHVAIDIVSAHIIISNSAN